MWPVVMRTGLLILLTGMASRCPTGDAFLPLGGMRVAPGAPAGQRPNRRDRAPTVPADALLRSAGRSSGEDTGEADMPPVGVGHLTMLDTAPPDWVSLAHDAGFDAVGIRAAAIGSRRRRMAHEGRFADACRDAPPDG
jgi:hypothetical protein